MRGFIHETPNGGVSVEWYTPPWVFQRLNLRFDLVPCHPDPRLPWVTADEVYSLPRDGLSLPWFGKV